MHLLKNIRHNSCTENTQALKFQSPERNENCIAKWKDLTKIYKKEEDSSILKEAKLNYSTLQRNNFEKEKMHLMIYSVE